MRLSDVINREVVDTAGRRWGEIHDACLVQDGPVTGEGDAAFRLHGIIAGRGAFATRLGYAGRVDKVRGPWIIRHLVHWFDRRAVYIPWEHVVRIERDRVVVEPPAEDGFRSA